MNKLREALAVALQQWETYAELEEGRNDLLHEDSAEGDLYREARAAVTAFDSAPAAQFKVGDAVKKNGGDYIFDGIVVSVFTKLSGKIRLVVEDDRGILHVFSERNLCHARREWTPEEHREADTAAPYYTDPEHAKKMDRLAAIAPAEPDWKCACGWQGRPKQMLANPSGHLCCPDCGGSGGLIREYAAPAEPDIEKLVKIARDAAINTPPDGQEPMRNAILAVMQEIGRGR